MVQQHRENYRALITTCTAIGQSSGSSGKRCVTSVRQAEVDTGHAPGVTTEENEERSRLRKENKRLRGATEILKKAIVFFAGELDSRNR